MKIYIIYTTDEVGYSNIEGVFISKSKAEKVILRLVENTNPLIKQKKLGFEEQYTKKRNYKSNIGKCKTIKLFANNYRSVFLLEFDTTVKNKNHLDWY